MWAIDGGYYSISTTYFKERIFTDPAVTLNSHTKVTAARHSKRANLLHVDGHTGTRDTEALGAMTNYPTTETPEKAAFWCGRQDRLTY